MYVRVYENAHALCITTIVVVVGRFTHKRTQYFV